MTIEKHLSDHIVQGLFCQVPNHSFTPKTLSIMQFIWDAVLDYK